MKIHSFADLAKLVDIEHCTGCSRPVDHQLGFAEPSVGRVHWRERKVTRGGMRNFLKLAGACVHHHNRGQPRWQQVYEQSRYALDQSRKYHLSIPPRLSWGDRAEVEDGICRSWPKPEITPEMWQWIRRRGP